MWLQVQEVLLWERVLADMWLWVRAAVLWAKMRADTSLLPRKATARVTRSVGTWPCSSDLGVN